MSTELRSKRQADEQLIAALCFAGRSNHLAVYKSGSTDYTFLTQQGSDAQLRIGSLLRPINWRPGSKLPNPLEGSLACYSYLMNFSAFGQRLMMVDATPVTYITAVLFADSVIKKPGSTDTLLINNFIPIKFRTKDPTLTASLLLEFREKWMGMMHDMLRGYTVRRDLNNSIRGRRDVKARRIMVQMIVDLINWEVRQRPGRDLLRDQYKDMYLELPGVLRKGILSPVEDEVNEGQDVDVKGNDEVARARRFKRIMDQPLDDYEDDDEDL